MTDLVHALTVTALFVLGIGWAAKLSLEADFMDVAGLLCTAFALGYLARGAV